jgi:hypothetical protein
MKQTVVDWLEDNLIGNPFSEKDFAHNVNIFKKAKEMEKNNTDNKVIHFAEWLTKKHTTVLMTLYEQFEEQNYNETYETK